MREIKFRAWDKQNNKYFRECCWLSFCPNGIRFMWTDSETDNMMVTELNDYELMQFTGLKDKNGKEIYEGDIVKYTVDLGGGSKKTYIGQVLWNSEWACWDIVSGPIHEFDWVKIARNGYEVIGNIYENPELLEAQKEGM